MKKYALVLMLIFISNLSDAANIKVGKVPNSESAAGERLKRMGLRSEIMKSLLNGTQNKVEARIGEIFERLSGQVSSNLNPKEIPFILKQAIWLDIAFESAKRSMVPAYKLKPEDLSDAIGSNEFQSAVRMIVESGNIRESSLSQLLNQFPDNSGPREQFHAIERVRVIVGEVLSRIVEQNPALAEHTSNVLAELENLPQSWVESLSTAPKKGSIMKVVEALDRISTQLPIETQ